jgi:hypothetical protein
LIAWHHRTEAIWDMTPRQVFAWVTLGLDREKMERATRLVDGANAARGEGGDIQRTVRELIGGG